MFLLKTVVPWGSEPGGREEIDYPQMKTELKLSANSRPQTFPPHRFPSIIMDVKQYKDRESELVLTLCEGK